MPFNSRFGASVTNAGTFDMTNGRGLPRDDITIGGDYIGDNGSLRIDTELGRDNSPSDELIIQRGVASGLTGLTVVNRGGEGAETKSDGILVVKALGGGTTQADAFVFAAPAPSPGPTSTSCSAGGSPPLPRTTGS